MRAPGQALVLAGPDGEECAAALGAALAAAEGEWLVAWHALLQLPQKKHTNN